MDTAFADAQGSAEALRGELRVATAPEFAENLIAPLLCRFQATYPGIALQVHVDATPQLTLEHYDVALLSAPEGARCQLCGPPAVQRRRHFVCRTALSGPARPAATPSDLLQHRCLLRRSPRLRRGVLQLWQQGSDVLEAPGFEGEVEPSITVNHTSSLLRMAIDGAGIAAFTHNVAAPYIAQGLLQHALPQWITGRFAPAGSPPSRRHMPARTKAFLDFLTEHHNHLALPVPSIAATSPPPSFHIKNGASPIQDSATSSTFKKSARLRRCLGVHHQRWQTVILELLTQLGLEHLACRTQRNGVHEHHVVRNLPFGRLALVKRQQCLARDLRARV